MGVGPVRNFATTRRPSRERAVHVGDGDRVVGAAGHLEGERDVVEPQVAPPFLPGQLGPHDPHPGLVPQGVEGSGRRGRVGPGTGDEHEVEGVASVGCVDGILLVEDAHEVGHGRGRHEQRSDTVGVPGAEMHGVLAHGVGQCGVAGREHRRVVDEPAEQHRCRRRHAPQPIASCAGATAPGSARGVVGEGRPRGVLDAGVLAGAAPLGVADQGPGEADGG